MDWEWRKRRSNEKNMLGNALVSLRAGHGMLASSSVQLQRDHDM